MALHTAGTCRPVSSSPRGRTRGGGEAQEASLPGVPGPTQVLQLLRRHRELGRGLQPQRTRRVQARGWPSGSQWLSSYGRRSLTARHSAAARPGRASPRHPGFLQGNGICDPCCSVSPSPEPQPWAHTGKGPRSWPCGFLRSTPCEFHL